MIKIKNLKPPQSGACLTIHLFYLKNVRNIFIPPVTITPNNNDIDGNPKTNNNTRSVSFLLFIFSSFRLINTTIYIIYLKSPY